MTELQRLVASQTDRLSRLFGPWTARDASAVEIWEAGAVVARWAPTLEIAPRARERASGVGRGDGPTWTAGRPTGPAKTTRQPMTSVPIEAGGRQVGWLRVVGTGSAMARQRLEANAATVSWLLEHEAELGEVTGALVDSNERLRALVALLGGGEASLDPAAVLATLADQVNDGLGYGGTAIAVPGEASWEVACARGTQRSEVEPVLEELASAVGDGLPGEVRSGRWFGLSVPMPDATLLVLLVRQGGSDPWTSDQLLLARTAAAVAASRLSQAGHAAEALRRATLERQLAFAGEVQRHLVGRPIPPSDHLDVVTRYRAAHAVGGDLVVVRRRGRQTLLALGDVSGKGAPAALLMATARGVIEAHSCLPSGPAAMLARIAGDLHDDLDRSGAFLTLCLAVHDPDTSTMRIANAGQAPVFLVGPDGATLVEPTEPPLGVQLEGSFTEVVLPFASGTLLAMASDGLSEREGPEATMFGIERFGALVREPEPRLDAVADRILAAIDAFGAGRPRSDDETLLLARAS